MEPLLPTTLPHAQAHFGTRHLPNLAQATQILGPIASMHQVHGATLTYATKATQYPSADALYTDIPNLWLAVKTADCTPCLISTPRAVAAVHLGWRSAQAGLLPLTLTTLQTQFSLQPEDIHLSFGPSLSPPHFEVEDTFPTTFNLPNQPPFFTPNKPGHVFMHLAAILTHQATTMGIPAANIQTSPHCTYAQSTLFHSYRRDKSNPGRQLSFIQFLKK